MNVRELLIGLALFCQIAGAALVKNAPDKSWWWVGSTLSDIGTPLMGAILIRDKRSAPKKPAAKPDLPPS